MKKQNLKAVAKWIPFVVTLFGTVLLVASLFMPYASAVGEYAEQPEEDPNRIVDTQTYMQAHEFLNVSVMEFAGIYSRLDGYFICTATAYIIAAFSARTLLVAVNKKPIATMIFDLLAFFVFLAQRWDYTDRGVVPSANYEWGVGYHLFCVATAVVFAGAMWMFVNNLLKKKVLQKAREES